MSTALASFAVIDSLTVALCAAELGQSVDVNRSAPELIDDFLASVSHLRTNVPFAAFRLLEQLSLHREVTVRVRVADALREFVDLYPAAVEDLLLALSRDASRRVRTACADALADVLQVSDLARIATRWNDSGRARQVLAAAKQRTRLVA